MKHTRPLGSAPKPLTDEERRQALQRMLTQKHETLFQGILFNTIQAGTFGQDLNAAVDASVKAADHAMDALFGSPEKAEAEQPQEQ